MVFGNSKWFPYSHLPLVVFCVERRWWSGRLSTGARVPGCNPDHRDVALRHARRLPLSRSFQTIDDILYIHWSAYMAMIFGNTSRQPSCQKDDATSLRNLDQEMSRVTPTRSMPVFLIALPRVPSRKWPRALISPLKGLHHGAELVYSGGIWNPWCLP